MPQGKRLLMLRAAAVLYLLLAGGIQVYFAQAVVRKVLHAEVFPEEPFGIGAAEPVIRWVNYGQDLGLKAGMRVIDIDGEVCTSQHTYSAITDRLKPGDTMSIKVADADGTAKTVRITLRSQAGGFDWSHRTWTIQFLFLSWFGFAIGAVAVLLKPWDRVAWFLAFLLLSFSYMWTSSNFSELPLAVRVSWLAMFWFLRLSWPLWLLLFGLYFPTAFPLSSWLRWLKWLLVLPLMYVPSVEALWQIAASESYRWSARVMRLEDTLDGLPTIVLFSVAVTAFFLTMGFRNKFPQATDTRRKLRLLQLGASVSFLPIAALFLTAAVVTRGFAAGTSFNAPQWVTSTILAAYMVFPLTLGYLVIVHRALDVRVAIRQGVQHALARRSIVVLQVVVAICATVIAARADSTYRLPAIATAIAAVFLMRAGGEKLREWIDRRFFRDAYRTDHVLTDLAESVRTIVETRPLLETVSQRIAETLHVPRIAVLLESSAGFAPAYALGYDAPPPVEFRGDAVTLREMKRSAEPLRVYFDDPASWLNRPTGPSGEERAQLTALEAQLLLPISIKDRVLGFLSLGAKRSEEPYSSTDVRLLQSIAGQTGLALENSRLATAIAEQTAARERVNRELEIAREVQRRFFPQRQPAIAGLDYAGVCRPAESVGGDYYDFRAMDGGRLGIAIGDVAGKGAPAALLMASLQASLRAQSIGGSADLAALTADLNSLISEITPASRFATLFYAQYQPASRRLAYVNAGHNPPLLVRAGQAKLLELGGPAIGLARAPHYVERQFDLRPGDLLVAYTDGITEAMNPRGEEFGVPRLCGALGTLPASASAAEVLSAVVAAVDAFAEGAPQHDDITLVVLRGLAD